MKFLLIFAFGVFFVDSVPVEESREEKQYVEPEYLDTLLREHRYKEFSDLMGLGNPRLAMPRNASDKSDPSFVDPSFIRGLFEGDIILSPQQEQARQVVDLDKYTGNKWQSYVPFAISTAFSANERAFILRGIEGWNSSFKSCLPFRERKSEKDYCMFIDGDGCYSHLGKTGGQQPISIQKNGCMSIGTIQHEMCHAIGAIHEQSRPDRDNNVTVLYNNIPSDWHSQYNKESASDFRIHGEYECGSAMHYPMNAPGTNKPAFEFKGNSCPDKTQVGQRRGLTATDVKKVKSAYKCQ